MSLSTWSPTSTGTIPDPSDLSGLLFSQGNDNDNDNDNDNEKGPNPYHHPPYYVSDRVKIAPVAHGRGLVATREIPAGTCLWVTPPTVSVDVNEVYQAWNDNDSDSASSLQSQSLEQVAEDCLLQAMRQALSTTSTTSTSTSTPRYGGVAKSFLALVGRKGGTCTAEADHEIEIPSIDCLLGNASTSKDDTDTCSSTTTTITDDDLLQLIRRNAFGPDFVTYQVMERKWNANANTNSSSGSNTNWRPHRILGMYPLAAMVNHSCHPKAVRVYHGTTETMVVHACETIHAGDEITWSYVPPIYPFPERQQMLQQTHGFVCACPRCTSEATIWNDTTDTDTDDKEEQVPTTTQTQTPKIIHPRSALERLVRLQDRNNDKLLSSSSLQGERNELRAAIALLEDDLLPSIQPNELQRYVRVGFTRLYMQYFNQALMVLAATNKDDDHEDEDSLLRLGTQLHFSFLSCDSASTEHLSILHLCYELQTRLHVKANKEKATNDDSISASKTLPKIRFWTEQVKKGCMVRYGSLGNDIDAVRQLLQHTRLVLRTPHGMEQAKYPFI
jgi:hypothetical protein